MMIPCPLRYFELLNSASIFSVERNRNCFQVWHASEEGVGQACAIWERRFAPFACFNAHEEAHRLMPRLSENVTNLQPSLFASDAHIEQENLSREVGGCAEKQTALARALGIGLSRSLSRLTVAPTLEWVRGWPIKPLALLLTSHERVSVITRVLSQIY